MNRSSSVAGVDNVSGAFYCKTGLSSHGRNAYFLPVCSRCAPVGASSSLFSSARNQFMHCETTLQHETRDDGGARRGFTPVSAGGRYCLTGWEAPGWSGLGLLKTRNAGYPNTAQPFPNPLPLFHSPLPSNLEISIWGCILPWLAATCHLPKSLS